MPGTVANPPQGVLLPVAPQQFTDLGGVALANGTVTTYVAGTDVLATTWQDYLLTTQNTNPVVLDSAGKATIWGLGNYTMVVKDSAGNQISSQNVAGGISSIALSLGGSANSYTVSVPGLVTSGLSNPLGQLSGIPLYIIAPASNTGATTVAFNGLAAIPVQYPNGNALSGGEIPSGAYVAVIYNPVKNVIQLIAASTTIGANLPGEIRAFAGATPPAGWALCYGQLVSRTTYPNTFAAIGTAWGAGDGSTTFGLPDLRGRLLAGVDAMGGTAADRITSASLGGTGVTATAFANLTAGVVTKLGLTNPGAGYTGVPTVTITGGGGSGATATATMANGVVTGLTITAGGSGYTSTPNVVISAPTGSTSATLGTTGGSELEQTHTHPLVDPGHVHSFDHTPIYLYDVGGGGYGNGSGQNINFGASNIATATTGISISNYGGGNSQNLPPIAVVNWIIALS